MDQKNFEDGIMESFEDGMTEQTILLEWEFRIMDVNRDGLEGAESGMWPLPAKFYGPGAPVLLRNVHREVK